MPGFRFAQLLWFMLLICTFLVFGGHRAEAETGLASWYGPGFQGKPTASGAPFDANGYTAASKTLPLGTNLLVSHKGRSVLVTVNDRGPYTGGRDLDLSQAAARDLGLIQDGVGYVEYNIVDKPVLGTSREAGQQPDLSREVTQQPGFSQSAAQQPGFSQGAAQQPGLTQFPQASGNYQTASPDYSGSSPAAQDEANDRTYVVQPGDTLTQIAARLGLSVDYLAKYNGITDPDVIYSGQPLYFQAPGRDSVAIGGNPRTDGVTMQNPLEMGNNAIVGEGDVVQAREGAVATGPASENGGQWVPDETGSSNDTVGYLLPATGA